MTNPVSQYFKCGDLFDIELNETLSSDAGFFRFGNDVICYGRSTAGARSSRADNSLHDTAKDVSSSSSGLRLPFDPDEVVHNLCNEKYISGARQADASTSSKLIQAVYYLLRPFLTLSVRKHLQKIHLRDWSNIPFPHWPVDRTVDLLMHKLLLLGAKGRGMDRVPFIWFWPDGANACSIMTHDVEAEPGRKFCTD